MNGADCAQNENKFVEIILFEVFFYAIKFTVTFHTTYLALPFSFLFFLGGGGGGFRHLSVFFFFLEVGR